ncbi:aa3-type cytochrome c oxidase subunit IV [Sphingobium nicotianae]|uniref:Aa3-type cytochrome c oxidase subunit IV n=1 Tax=Sphingobium nicotianae TaxID=2782607 RepID=A0A9X1D8L5_9SPHN|nr:aa3-type cytochrome c oxidase subunit IV [Sphingobium nicotianae]MBT2185794.1 aa3-type cytochrome c oxidase subunit IV [Sphingobium nicotianae]
MAEHQDMTQANNTFSAFTTLMKWGTIVSVIAGLLVILIISHGGGAK